MSDLPSQNSSDEHAPQTRADEFAERLLDDDAAAEVAIELSSGERQRVADLQWLDALLEHSQGRNRAAIDRAVASVLTRLHAEPVGRALLPVEPRRDSSIETGKSARPTRRWIPTLIAAAAVVLVGVVWWQQRPNSAYAMVEQAYQAALRPTDRTYRVTLASDATALNPRTATLTVRGGERFVVELTGPLGGQNWIGGNGREFWFVPPVGPALVADSEHFVGQWLNRSQADLPFLQLTTILQRLREHYDLTSLPDEPLAANGLMLRHLHAQRRGDAAAEHPRLPETVELWADPQTGVVQRLILNRSPESARPGPQTITFDLTHEEPRTTEFYDFSTHAPSRPVRRLPEPAPTTQP